MESDGGPDIDLYAEDMDPDFISSQDDFKCEAVDLYDAVITNSVEVGGGDLNSSGAIAIATTLDRKPSSTSLSKETTPQTAKKKHQACVGNLTWWTTDKNIQDSLEEIGVEDFEEVKFYENRNNGQSKGYCMVTVGSELSISLIHEKLPKKEIQGQVPIVTPPTKQALMQFEALVKTRPAPTAPQCNQGNNGNWNGPGHVVSPRMGGMGFNNHGPRMMMRVMRGGPGPMGMPPHRHMLPQHGSPGNRPPMMCLSLPPGPPPPHGPPPPGLNMMGPRPGRPIHPPMMDPRGPPSSPRDWNRPPMGGMNDFSSPREQAPAPLSHLGSGPVSLPPLRGGPLHMMNVPPYPAPHMNPAFFNLPPRSESGLLQAPPMYAGSLSGRRAHSDSKLSPPRSRVKREPGSPISDAEFEDAMTRNTIVSSTAISRAVEDAESGEYGSAIETLVTAISLLKASKVAHRDRCKVLIGSLQNTLFGIEANSYGQGRRERSRSLIREHGRFRKDRSRSREHRSRSREKRSRSWERRDYRDRSRERKLGYRKEKSRSPEEREYKEIRESSSRSRYREEMPRSRDRDSRGRDRERTGGESEREKERRT